MVYREFSAHLLNRRSTDRMETLASNHSFIDLCHCIQFLHHNTKNFITAKLKKFSLFKDTNFNAKGLNIVGFVDLQPCFI